MTGVGSHLTMYYYIMTAECGEEGSSLPEKKTSSTIDLLLTSSTKLLSRAIAMAAAPVLQLKICSESDGL